MIDFMGMQPEKVKTNERKKKKNYREKILLAIVHALRHTHNMTGILCGFCVFAFRLATSVVNNCMYIHCSIHVFYTTLKGK